VCLSFKLSHVSDAAVQLCSRASTKLASKPVSQGKHKLPEADIPEEDGETKRQKIDTF